MVLAIGNQMNQQDCRNWINDHGITHPVLSDMSYLTYPLFGNGYIPFNAVIDYDSLLLWSDSGYNDAQMRNRINQQIARNPRIYFTPLPDSEDTSGIFEVELRAASISDLQDEGVILFWSNSGAGPFTEVIMIPHSGKVEDSMYYGEIPAQEWDTTVYYYIQAEDVDQRMKTDPENAPAEVYNFYVGPDETPPVIDHDPMSDLPQVAWPAEITATVTDNLGLFEVALEYRIDGGSFQTITMTEGDDDQYAAEMQGTVEIGSVIEYRISATDASSAGNQSYDPESGYHTFDIIDRISVFVYDPDSNASSGPVIRDLLNDNEISNDYSTELVDILEAYQCIFVCLGVYSDNYVLSSDEGDALASYLDAGGRLYMEGGDTWNYDPQTAVHPYFNINGVNDGQGNAGPIEGVPGTITEGFNFQYSGENNYIDQLQPLNDAAIVLKNVSPVYNNGIAYDGGTYKTLGSSFEFGGLSDGSATTKWQLLRAILQFFDVQVSEFTPTPDPSPTPSVEPTEPPTQVPTDIPTAAPTMTPVCTGFSYRLNLNQDTFQAGDDFDLRFVWCNAEATKTGMLFVILDIFGEFWFHPDWTQDVSWENITFPTMSSFIQKQILFFEWPENAGELHDIRFWTGVLDAHTGAVLGEISFVNWGFE